MNKLQDLIDTLCPDGVEYEKFNNICTYIRGVTYNKSKEVNEDFNAYKVLRANNICINTSSIIYNEIKFISNTLKVKEEQFLKKNDILICAGSGSKEHIGKVAFISEDINFIFGGFMGVIRINSNLLLPKYLFYLLGSNIFKKYLKYSLNSSTINNLNSQIMNNFKIPLPPIEIQSEIVLILDNFTELTAELTARKKQYEYYREKLLTFGDEVERVELGKCIDLVMGVSPKKETFSNNKYNGIEFHQGKSFFGNIYINNSNIYTSKPLKFASKNSILMSVRAPVGDTNLTDREIAIGRGLCSISGKSNVKNKYLYYFLKTYIVEIKRKSTSSTFEGIKTDEIKKIKIPLPPLEEQQKIVDILDRFDVLCNDITKGLPAEIEARQKQYKYYRDKLLTFKEKTK